MCLIVPSLGLAAEDTNFLENFYKNIGKYLYDQSATVVSAVPTNRTPHLSIITPSEANEGRMITLKGAGFSASDSKIEFMQDGAIKGTLSVASTTNDGQFAFVFLDSRMSANLSPGMYQVRVVQSNGISNSLNFTLLGEGNPQIPVITGVTITGTSSNMLPTIPSTVGPISLSHESQGEYMIYNSRYDIVTITAKSPFKSANNALQWRVTFKCTGAIQVSLLGVGGPENYCNGRAYDIRNNTLSNDVINLPFAAKRLNAYPASVKVKVQLFEGDQRKSNKVQEGTYDIGLATG